MSLTLPKTSIHFSEAETAQLDFWMASYRASLPAIWSQAREFHPAIWICKPPTTVWKPGMRTTIGRAYCRKRSVALNPRLYLRAPKEERWNTLIHEISHIVEFSIYKRTGHGKNFKAIMLHFGENPSRCHDVDTTGLRRKAGPRHKYYSWCSECAEGDTLSAVEGKKALAGKVKIRCMYCDKIAEVSAERIS